MKPVGVVGAYTVKSVIACLYEKFRETLMYIEKNVLQWIPNIIESTTFVLSFFI